MLRLRSAQTSELVETGFGGPDRGCVHQPGGATPAGQDRDVLGRRQPCRSPGCHDACTRVEAPQRFAVGGPIGCEDPVGAALENQIAASCQHAGSVQDGILRAPDGLLRDDWSHARSSPVGAGIDAIFSNSGPS